MDQSNYKSYDDGAELESISSGGSMPIIGATLAATTTAESESESPPRRPPQKKRDNKATPDKTTTTTATANDNRSTSILCAAGDLCELKELPCDPNKHKCIECKRPMHAPCGKEVDDGVLRGSAYTSICYLCWDMNSPDLAVPDGPPVITNDSHQHATATPPLFPIGSYVAVASKNKKGKRNSDGGLGFIVSDGPEKFDVRYTVENRLSQDVSVHRIEPAAIQTLSRQRSANQESGPSLLSNEYQTLTAATATNKVAVSQSQKARPSSVVEGLIQEHNKTHHRSKTKISPILEALKGGSKKSYGWMRTQEATTHDRSIFNREKFKHLNDDERLSVYRMWYTIKNCFYPEKRGYSPQEQLGHAWGVSDRTLRNIIKAANRQQGVPTRKIRSDKGKNVFESEEIRERTYTPYKYFRKMRMSEEMAGERVSAPQLKRDWDALSDVERNFFAVRAKEELQQAQFLKAGVQQTLARANGNITWRKIAQRVSGDKTVRIVTHVTVMKYVMGLPDSGYQSTKIHPKLDDQHIKRRYEWTINFWLFWNGAKLMNGAQILLTHMDEKWFYGIVVRKHNKVVPCFGCYPRSMSVHHKSHINKIMAIAVTGFAPINNNVKAGGFGYKVCLNRAGKMMVAKKDSYKRVYNDDGTYCYPKISGNKLREKGKRYFESLEITGSSRGTLKEPKYSLLDWFSSEYLPALDRIARKYESENPGKKLIVVGQFDGAGPHQDRKLNQYMESCFATRDWIIKFQPSQSPLTNVKDASIFPAMSKIVTAQQGGRPLHSSDELWNAVKNVWDSFPNETIARAYTSHHQIVNAIHQCKGGDEFAKEKNGLHFGVRKLCVPYWENNPPNPGEKPAGVMVLDHNADSAEDALSRSNLKYPTPDVSTFLPHEYLSSTQFEVLLRYMDEAAPLYPLYENGYFTLCCEEEERERIEQETNN